MGGRGGGGGKGGGGELIRHPVVEAFDPRKDAFGLLGDLFFIFSIPL